MRFVFRRRDRVTRQLIRDRERLAVLEVGGSSDRPFHVASASVIEVRVRNLECPQCRGTYKLVDHRAPGRGLRQTTVICNQCGISRDLWFKVITHDPN
jgi:hypothetical protein